MKISVVSENFEKKFVKLKRLPDICGLFLKENILVQMKINTQSFPTYSAKPNEIKRNWYIADASGQTLGHFAAKIAGIIRGKHKPQFTSHVDTGDFVIVINADKIKLTGSKASQKEYYHNTQYPGGARFEKFKEVLATKPEQIIEKAVWGMLPHNNLGRKLYTKLKVYAGTAHPHTAQNPITLKLN
jgi:large subunit ribosomal protein L13